MVTDVEIEKWLYGLIAESNLAKAVSGRLTDRGRPKESAKEDIVINCYSLEGSGQEQIATVNINIYVSDIWNVDTANWERDTIRINELCNLCKFLYRIYDNGMRVTEESRQKTFPLNVEFQDGHTEHFINNKLKINICND